MKVPTKAYISMCYNAIMRFERPFERPAGRFLYAFTNWRGGFSYERKEGEHEADGEAEAFH